MIIGIVPKIKKKIDHLFDFSLDNDLISFFFSNVFPKSQIKALVGKKAYQIDLLILSGGNTPYHLSKTKEKHDEKITRFISLYLKLSKKEVYPSVGICHGAQIIAL